jgi:hypothetical protein
MDSQEEVPVKKKKTGGQLFKEKFGYSKSMKKNMQKHGLDPMAYSDSINEYRAIRKKRRKEAQALRQKKHELAKAQRGNKSSTGKKR